jgi:hypothetical protein
MWLLLGRLDRKSFSERSAINARNRTHRSGFDNKRPWLTGFRAEHLQEHQ